MNKFHISLILYVVCCCIPMKGQDLVLECEYEEPKSWFDFWSEEKVNPAKLYFERLDEGGWTVKVDVMKSEDGITDTTTYGPWIFPVGQCTLSLNDNYFKIKRVYNQKSDLDYDYYELNIYKLESGISISIIYDIELYAMKSFCVDNVKLPYSSLTVDQGFKRLIDQITGPYSKSDIHTTMPPADHKYNVLTALNTGFGFCPKRDIDFESAKQKIFQNADIISSYYADIDEDDGCPTILLAFRDNTLTYYGAPILTLMMVFDTTGKSLDYYTFSVDRSDLSAYDAMHIIDMSIAALGNKGVKFKWDSDPAISLNKYNDADIQISIHAHAEDKDAIRFLIDWTGEVDVN